MKKRLELQCETEPILSSYITQTILHSDDFDNGLEHIPDDVMARLLERISKHREEHIKDPQVLAKVIELFFFENFVIIFFCSYQH